MALFDILRNQSVTPEGLYDALANNFDMESSVATSKSSIRIESVSPHGWWSATYHRAHIQHLHAYCDGEHAKLVLSLNETKGAEPITHHVTLPCAADYASSLQSSWKAAKGAFAADSKCTSKLPSKFNWRPCATDSALDAACDGVYCV
jgi:hypothetical protein